MTQAFPQPSPRQELQPCKRIVVKIGSALLASGGPRYFGRIARQISRLRTGGVEVILVSSGAVALGLPILGYARRPQRLDALQAAAAVGQPVLVHRWSQALAKRSIPTGQMLLTHADLASRERFLNARHTLFQLLRRKVVPVINENDSVATDEIRVGDNDNLAALVAALANADLLVLLTTAHGVFSANPETEPDAQRITTVTDIDAIFHVAGDAGSTGLGVGGMRTKLVAAKTATSRRIQVVVAHGNTQNVLPRVLAGEDIGTLFLAPNRMQGRKHWIAYTLKPQGTLHIDIGAAAAIRNQGSSLLPSGVSRLEGTFGRGEMVEIVGPEGIVARGLAAYSAAELSRLLGEKSSDIVKILGYAHSPAAVDRDDMVIVAK